MREIEANLLESPECNIIAHQVNCKGVMGAGLALQIKNKYPKVFEEYRRFCNDTPKTQLLGSSLVLPTYDNKVIINVFAQYNFGYGQCQTNYTAFSKSMDNAIVWCKELHKDHVKIGIPYKIGCNLAGGDWDVIQRILTDIENKNLGYVEFVIHKYTPSKEEAIKESWSHSFKYV